MDRLAQLQSHSEVIAPAVNNLAGHRRHVDSSDEPRPHPGTNQVPERAKANILASATGIKTLVGGPADFLRYLATQVCCNLLPRQITEILIGHILGQVEIIACLRWLCEFQILVCIPLELSVPIKDVADLSGVPESQLRRVIRLTATYGFLDEPQPSLVAHTPLSAQFIADQSFVDAAMFLADSAAPTALQMALATQCFGASQRPSESAYNLALNTIKPFHVACQERPKLSRQWSAYLQHAAGLHRDEEVVELLPQLNWLNLSNACIVEVRPVSRSI